MINIGETMTYTFTINNLSNVGSPDLIFDSITDDKLDDAVLLSALQAANPDCEILAVGDSCSFEFDKIFNAIPNPNPEENEVNVFYHPFEFANVITDSDTHAVEVKQRSVGFIIIDEDSIDNGINYFEGGPDGPEEEFSDTDVNDQLAEIGFRKVLKFFENNVGETITVFTGQVGDEGWFAPQFIPASWDAAGPTDDGLRNFVGDPSDPPDFAVGGKPQRFSGLRRFGTQILTRKYRIVLESLILRGLNRFQAQSP